MNDGFNNQHLAWQDLKQWDLKTTDVAFGRTPESIRAYTEHKRELSLRKVSLKEFVQATILGTQPYAISANMFRYNIDLYIRHMVFWMNSGIYISMEQAKKIVSRDLNADQRDIIIFENSPANKSIPDIPHYQVFIKLSHRDL